MGSRSIQGSFKADRMNFDSVLRRCQKLFQGHTFTHGDSLLKYSCNTVPKAAAGSLKHWPKGDFNPAFIGMLETWIDGIMKGPHVAEAAKG